MEKHTLETHVIKHLSIRAIAREIGISYTTVKYWLDKYSLKTSRPPKETNKICRLCDKKISDNLKNRFRCHSCNTKIRRVRAKQAAIKYLGGECKKCGYNKHPAAMDFHHRDVSDKDFNIGAAANKKWEVIKKELDKCDLLCANCHREEHSNRTEEKVLKEVALYKGRLLAL